MLSIYPLCISCILADIYGIDMSAELPEHERKSFAAKAVRDIMKEL